jgi:NAD(P)H-dependent FMN reductase
MDLAVMGGSLRPASLNTRLLRHLARELEGRGHTVSAFAGGALRLPLYEEGAEPSAEVGALHRGLLGAQGLVIVSPEYNASIPGHLKNAVDWLSTLKPSPWPGLPVLLCSASPGAFGGARGQVAWRATLANMGALALPESISVPHADRQLDAEGAPTDPRTAAALPKVLDGFLALAARLRPEPCVRS